MSTALDLHALRRRTDLIMDEHGQAITVLAERLAASSETEVSSAVNALSGTVDEANGYVEEVETILGELRSGEAADLEQALKEQSEMLSELNEILQQQHRDQQVHIELALKRCSEILRAADRITAVSFASNVLALYTRVETSALGADSGELILVADELSKLNASVSRANVIVGRLVAGLRVVLPTLITDSGELHEQAIRFTQEARADMVAIASSTRAMSDAVQLVCQLGAERSNDVVTHTQTALSHMAVQDPMAQRLRGLSAEVVDLKARMSAILQGDLHVIEDDEQDSQDAIAIEMGDMMLF